MTTSWPAWMRPTMGLATTPTDSTSSSKSVPRAFPPRDTRMRDIGVVVLSEGSLGRPPHGWPPQTPLVVRRWWSGLLVLAVDGRDDAQDRRALHEVVLPVDLVRRVGLDLLARTDTDHGDDVAAGDGHSVGGERPLVDARRAIHRLMGL